MSNCNHFCCFTILTKKLSLQLYSKRIHLIHAWKGVGSSWESAILLWKIYHGDLLRTKNLITQSWPLYVLQQLQEWQQAYMKIGRKSSNWQHKLFICVKNPVTDMLPCLREYNSSCESTTLVLIRRFSSNFHVCLWLFLYLQNL